MKNTQYEKISKKIESWLFGFRVKQRRFTFIVTLLIIIGGIFSVITIPKESSPEIEFWIISISTIYQWATPKDVDNLITEKIEKSIENVEWISKISSSSRAGISSIIVEFDNDIDMIKATADIKDAVDKVSLPNDAEETKIQDISANNEMMFSVILYWDSNKFDPFYIKEKWRLIKANLEWKNGINRIDFDSAMNMSIWSISNNWDSFYDIQVYIDKEKAESLWISLAYISQTIKSWNTNQPIWTHTIWNLWYDFRIQWEISSIQELGDIPLQINNGYIKLNEISKIKRILKNDDTQIMWSHWLSWQNFVNLFFNKKKWDNLFEGAKKAKKALEEEFNKTEYTGLKYTIALDLSDMIWQDYDDLAKNWLQTLILVFLALLVFVWFKESLIATITLPLAFFMTFIVLKNMWLSLNFLTNFSFIITFGIAIDTTIVVIEWAHEKIKQWFNPINAILLAVREYKTPLISGTATTVVVFVPLLTLPGIMWKFLAYIPITIFSTLISALIISLTINSALYYKLSKPKKYFNSNVWDVKYLSKNQKILLENDRVWKTEIQEENKNKRDKLLDKLTNRYSNKLDNIITSPKKRILSIILPIWALLLSFVTISPFLWFELFPASDNGSLSMTIEWPSGLKKEIMEKYNKELEVVLSNQKEIKVYYSIISNNTINTNIELIPKNIRKKKNMMSSLEIENFLDKNLSFLRSYWLSVSVKAESNWPPSSQTIWIKLITKNTNKLEELNKVWLDFKNYLQTIPGIKNIESSSKQTPGQFVYKFDKSKLSLLWLNPSNFLFEIFSAANWIGAWTIKWKYDSHDIKLYYDSTKDNINPQTINDTNISTNKWKVNFGSVSSYSFESAINTIDRENWEILISIWADVEEWINSENIQNKLENFAKNYKYPSEITYSIWWESAENQDLIQAMMIAFAVAMISIFAILVLQFNSYTQPIIISYSVIMWILWANIWLRITWQSYGLMFGIWFIALTWIIVNDSIVLIDRINNNIKKWMDKLSAIKESGKARLQPIILTTLTTFLWLMSIVSDAMWTPLAITIMVWILFWSAVALFVIPNLYFDKEKLKHIIRRTLLKYFIYLFIPLVISILVILILMILWIQKDWLFWQLFLAIFIWFNIWYWFYTIHALSQNWQTIIQKLLGTKILAKNWEIMTEKQATKRFFVSLAVLIWPIVVAGIVSWIVWIISSSIWSALWMIIWVWWYLYIFTKTLISIRTSENNQSWTDKICNTITIDEKIVKD